MDIELLKTFLEVGKTRHFGKAADNLFITQAAVSSRVKQLEEIIGSPLFTRLRNNIQLTIAGEKLTKHAEEILLKWDSARLDIARHSEGKGRIVIGATIGLWNLMLQRCLSFINKKTPNDTLKTDIDTDHNLFKKLLSQQIDIAFCYEKPRHSSLVAKEFLSFQLSLLTTLDSQDINTLMNEQYIHLNWGKNFQLWHVENFGDISPPIIETQLADIAIEYILKNKGSAFLPYDFLQKGMQKKLSLIDCSKFKQSIYFVYNKHSKTSEQLKTIIESLKPKIEDIEPEIEYPVQL